MISVNMEVILKQQAIITELMSEVKLKRQNMDQDKKIVFLENWLDSLAQYSRMNDAFSRRWKAHALESSPDSESTTEEQVKSFLL